MKEGKAREKRAGKEEYEENDNKEREGKEGRREYEREGGNNMKRKKRAEDEGEKIEKGRRK